MRNLTVKAKSLICLSVSAVLVSACSSTSIAPVAGNLSNDEFCIIPDVSDRKVAYSSTIKALTAKGFTVREVSSANTSDCSKVISCQSQSHWDLANFTSDISYEYYENGELKGTAKYHAANGLNFTKFINTQEKVNEMLNKLFPTTVQLQTRY